MANTLLMHQANLGTGLRTLPKWTCHDQCSRSSSRYAKVPALGKCGGLATASPGSAGDLAPRRVQVSRSKLQLLHSMH